jgi:hypothetical protein
MEITFPNLDTVQKEWQAEFQLLTERQQAELTKQIATQLEAAVNNKIQSGIIIIDDDGQPKKASGGIIIEFSPNKTSFNIIFHGDMEIIEYGNPHNRPQPIIRPLLDQFIHQNNA